MYIHHASLRALRANNTKQDGWVDLNYSATRGPATSQAPALTILRDEGDAAVYDDGDVIPAELLVPQRVALTTGCLLDVGDPQGEVCAAHAMQMKRSMG